MTKGLLKKILLTIYLLVISIIIILIFHYKNLFLDLNLENVQSKHEELKAFLNNNKLISICLYLFSSIIWICFVGIVSPLLFISTLLFGYFGILVSIFSYTLGSILTFCIANYFNDYLKKILIESDKIPNFKEKSVFFFTIFRVIPGMPFVIKNISAIFFNLTYKQFILATILAEVPQIILFTYIFKKAIDTSKNLASELSLNTLTNELFIPSILLLIFFILLFYLKNKYSKYFNKIT